jgi:hypothetical protein
MDFPDELRTKIVKVNTRKISLEKNKYIFSSHCLPAINCRFAPLLKLWRGLLQIILYKLRSATGKY